MARGIIKLPVDSGRKELTWQVGRSLVRATNETSVTVALRINRDSDFVAKRLWLVMTPPAAPPTASWPAGLNGLGGLLPADATVILKYGGAGNQKLSLVPGGSQSMLCSMSPSEVNSVDKGLAAPMLLAANTVLYAEVVCPSRSTTVWPGDLYLVAEGYKLYPTEADPIPASINALAYDYRLNGNLSLIEPVAGVPSSFAEQMLTITNDGDGKFIAKGIRFSFNPYMSGNDPANLALMLASVGINIDDSTSGSKPWVQDSTPNAGVVRVPAAIITGNYGFIPWSCPRLIDDNGVVRIRFIFEPWQGFAGWTWPTMVSVSLFGALLPRS